MVERIAYRLVVHRGFRAVAVLGQGRWLRFRVVSVLLGLLLVTSAVLKTHQLATEPVRGTGLLESRWFVTAVVQYELLLSFWLFCGLFRRTAWWVSVGTFAGFAVVAAAKAVSGEASCGCFGRLPTSPWLAVSIDVSAVLALCACRFALMASERVPCVSSVASRGDLVSAPNAVVSSSWTHGCFIGTWFVAAAGLAFIAVRGVQSRELSGIGQRIGDFVVVEPERMIGQPFQLGKYIDIGDRLARGRWVVVFYRSGCANCEKLMEHWGMAIPETLQGAKTAFISVLPDSLTSKSSLDGVWWGALEQSKEWFMATPTVVVLSNNRVLYTRSGPEVLARCDNELEIPGGDHS